MCVTAQPLRRDEEDFLWRPTFLKEAKPVLRTDFLSDPHNRLFLAYAQSVGELEHPKKALQLFLRDGQRLAAYQQACAASLPGAHPWAFYSLPAHAAQANARLYSRLAQESSRSSARGLELRASMVCEQ